MILKPTIKNFAKAACLSLFAIVFAGSSAMAQDTTDLRQERLVSLLASGNDEQKLEAAIEIGTLLSSVKATSQIASSLEVILQRDPSAVLRALAARAMELSGDDRFVPVLLSSLNAEREIAVRRAIIHALALHNSSQVVMALLPMLNDKSQDIRAAAAYSLAEIGDPASPSLSGLKDALIDLLRKRGKEEDAFARSQAARGLGKIGDRAAIDELLNALNRDKSPEVRRASAWSLGQIANSQDVKVIEALKMAKLQPDPYLAASAASALERIKP